MVGNSKPLSAIQRARRNSDYPKPSFPPPTWIEFSTRAGQFLEAREGILPRREVAYERDWNVGSRPTPNRALRNQPDVEAERCALIANVERNAVALGEVIE